MIPSKYDNYLVYKFVLGFYTNTMKLYIIKKNGSVNIVDLTKKNTESGIKIKISQFLTNLWYSKDHVLDMDQKSSCIKCLLKYSSNEHTVLLP